MFGSLFVFAGLLFLIIAVLLAVYSPGTEIELGSISGPAWIVFLLIGLVLLILGGAVNQIQTWFESLFSQ